MSSPYCLIAALLFAFVGKQTFACDYGKSLSCCGTHVNFIVNSYKQTSLYITINPAKRARDICCRMKHVERCLLIDTDCRPLYTNFVINLYDSLHKDNIYCQEYTRYPCPGIQQVQGSPISLLPPRQPPRIHSTHHRKDTPIIRDIDNTLKSVLDKAVDVLKRTTTYADTVTEPGIVLETVGTLNPEGLSFGEESNCLEEEDAEGTALPFLVGETRTEATITTQLPVKPVRPKCTRKIVPDVIKAREETNAPIPEGQSKGNGCESSPEVNTLSAQTPQKPNGITKSSGEETPSPKGCASTKQGPNAAGWGEQGPTARGSGEQGPIAVESGEQGPTATGSGEQSPTAVGSGEQGPTALGPGEQGPTAAGSGEQGPTAAGSEEQGPTAAESGEQGPTATKSREKIPTSKGSGERSPTAKGSGEQGPAAAESGEQSPAAAESGEQGPAAAESGEQGPAAAESGEQSPAAAESGEQGPAAAESGEQGPAAVESGEQGPTAAGSGEKGPTAAGSGEKGPTAAGSGEKGPNAAESGEQGPIAAESGEQGPITTRSGKQGPTAAGSGEKGPTTVDSEEQGKEATKAGSGEQSPTKGDSEEENPTGGQKPCSKNTQSNDKSGEENPGGGEEAGPKVSSNCRNLESAPIKNTPADSEEETVTGHGPQRCSNHDHHHHGHGDHHHGHGDHHRGHDDHHHGHGDHHHGHGDHHHGPGHQHHHDNTHGDHTPCQHEKPISPEEIQGACCLGRYLKPCSSRTSKCHHLYLALHDFLVKFDCLNLHASNDCFLKKTEPKNNNSTIQKTLVPENPSPSKADSSEEQDENSHHNHPRNLYHKNRNIPKNIRPKKASSEENEHDD